MLNTFKTVCNRGNRNPKQMSAMDAMSEYYEACSTDHSFEYLVNFLFFCFLRQILIDECSRVSTFNLVYKTDFDISHEYLLWSYALRQYVILFHPSAGLFEMHCFATESIRIPLDAI